MITVLEMFFDRNNYQKDIIKTTYWRSVKLKVVVCYYVIYVHQLPVQHVQIHVYMHVGDCHILNRGLFLSP